MKRIEAIIFGKVQGVSFRYYTKQKAAQLSVTGWVKNEKGGTVRIVAEGDQSALEKFISFLHNGSPLANVSQVELDWGESTGEFSSFKVRWL